jgi:hypothetical protein
MFNLLSLKQTEKHTFIVWVDFVSIELPEAISDRRVCIKWMRGPGKYGYTRPYLASSHTLLEEKANFITIVKKSAGGYHTKIMSLSLIDSDSNKCFETVDFNLSRSFDLGFGHQTVSHMISLPKSKIVVKLNIETVHEKNLFKFLHKTGKNESSQIPSPIMPLTPEILKTSETEPCNKGSMLKLHELECENNTIKSEIEKLKHHISISESQKRENIETFAKLSKPGLKTFGVSAMIDEIIVYFSENANFFNIPQEVVGNDRINPYIHEWAMNFAKSLKDEFATDLKSAYWTTPTFWDVIIKVYQHLEKSELTLTQNELIFRQEINHITSTTPDLQWNEFIFNLLVHKRMVTCFQVIFKQDEVIEKCFKNNNHEKRSKLMQQLTKLEKMDFTLNF